MRKAKKKQKPHRHHIENAPMPDCWTLRKDHWSDSNLKFAWCGLWKAVGLGGFALCRLGKVIKNIFMALIQMTIFGIYIFIWRICKTIGLLKKRWVLQMHVLLHWSWWNQSWEILSPRTQLLSVKSFGILKRTTHTKLKDAKAGHTSKNRLCKTKRCNRNLKAVGHTFQKINDIPLSTKLREGPETLTQWKSESVSQQRTNWRRCI